MHVGDRRVRQGMSRIHGTLFLALSLALTLSAPALGAALPLPEASAGKLDLRLLPALQSVDATPVSAWVTFADKGESGPADLVRRLGEAEAALDPHARARREKAGLSPLVDYLDLPLEPSYVEQLEALGLEPYGASRWFNAVAVRASGDQLAALAALPCVSHLAPVELGRLSPAPVEPLSAAAERAAAPSAAEAAASLSYGLTAKQVMQIGVSTLHDSGYVGTGVRICMLDDGFNHWNDHPAFGSTTVLATRDFIKGITSVTDLSQPAAYEHGTNTFGCIAGNVPGTYVGTAPGAAFLLARTEEYSSEHQVEMVYWGMGAEWADSAGADVISSSLGYTTFDSPDTSYTYAAMDGHTTIISRACEIAASKGILVVNAVGNDGNSTWHYLGAPADVCGDSMLAVGAVDSNGNVVSFSSYGPSYDGRIKPDVAARGAVDWLVWAAGYPGYYRASGTSFSTPLMAGLAACVIQARPAWPPTLVVRAIKSTASHPLAPDNRTGWGIANGGAVLTWDPGTVGVPLASSRAPGLRLAGANPITAARPSTAVVFGLAAGSGPARLGVLDVQGRRVRDLTFGGNPAPGGDGRAWRAAWDGRDDAGRLLEAGIYFITLETGGRRSALRVVSMR
jgi:serine protease AprX